MELLRELTPADFNTVVAHGLAMAAESPVYHAQEHDPEYTLAYLQSAWDAGMLLGVISSFARGCILGSVGSTWASPTLRASEWMLYVKPEFRGSSLALRLVRQFETMCRNRGAKKLYCGSSTGINDAGVQRFYERLGYQSVGSALSKEL